MMFKRKYLFFPCFFLIIANILHKLDNLGTDECLLYFHIRILSMSNDDTKELCNNQLEISNNEILSGLQHDHNIEDKQVIKFISKDANSKYDQRRKHIILKISKKKVGNMQNIRKINFNEVKQNDDGNSEINNSNTTNEADPASNSTKYNKNKRSGYAKNKVDNFVKLMKDINDNMENEKEKESYKPNTEDNVYSDEHHTVVIYDGLDENKDLYNKYKVETENNMDTRVIQGTEYLGVGYDFLFGNPIGDPFLKVDPGYRDSVIKLTYPKSDADYPDNYININPNGSYVRNEISCNRSENETEISTMSEYSKELSVDASLGASYGLFGSFSASVGYASASNTISKKKFRMFILKSYCFKYVASLSQYSQWKLSDQFLRAINLLPSYFNSLEHDGKYCNAEELRDNKTGMDSCGKSVESWLYFFKNFGTHVSTVIHLGGKITQQVKISKNEYKSLSESGLSTSVSASVGFGLFKANASSSTDSKESSNEESSNSSIEKETVIIGGTTIYDPNDPSNFEKWADSIKNNPMPIKGQYEPLSRILPERLTKIYDEALSFYVSLNVPINIGSKTDGEIKNYNLKSQLMKSKIIHGSGSGLVVLECEDKQNFILGFSLSIPNDLSNLKDFYMNTCDEESDKCYSKMSDNAYSYIFAMCNDERIPYLEQKAKSGTGLLTLECSEKNQIILFGFGISVLNSSDPSIAMYPCKNAKPSCSMQGSTDQSAVGLWIVCGHEESLNSSFSVNIRKLEKDNVSGKKKKKIDICPISILFNLIFEFTKTPPNKRSGKCFSANPICPGDFHVCSDKKGIKSFNYYSVSVY
ncbi:perforin-like protein 3 [Plasmodium chabaudi chabaudi]|uniref:Perforin-like protein 3 n=1 Tax=Plasmodium chabaudi chabaudi TaxID=31271 RepID=A0A1D3RU88_PLACU|nr:perforin-like protein 3 [Plasmodium chabaudi chabaudi]